MLCNPLLHLDAKPEAVDTAGDDGEEEPLDVVAKQLTALAVKSNLVSVNHGVLCNTTLIYTNCSRSANAKCNRNQK